jgi:protoheme ferro-lyase
VNTHHVVLLTYGEPPAPDFLSQLRYSWRILLGLTRSVASIPGVVLPIIALSRARLRTTTWVRESYGSPLEALTRGQATALDRALTTRLRDVRSCVHVAYEFRDPLLVPVLAALPENDPVDVIPMYVTDSAFTHELSRVTIDAWLRRRFPAGRPAPVRVMPPLDEERLAEVSAAHVLSEMRRLGVQGGGDCALMLAAHGTLMDPPRPYETGRLATERLCAGIARRLAPHFGSITNGWLNHVYGGRWTQPPVEHALKEIADAGYRRVIYYPYGFLADNAESQLEGRVALRGEPRLQGVHLDCLNASDGLLELLFDQVANEGHELGAGGMLAAR